MCISCDKILLCFWCDWKTCVLLWWHITVNTAEQHTERTFSPCEATHSVFPAKHPAPQPGRCPRTSRGTRWRRQVAPSARPAARAAARGGPATPGLALLFRVGVKPRRKRSSRCGGRAWERPRPGTPCAAGGLGHSTLTPAPPRQTPAAPRARVTGVNAAAPATHTGRVKLHTPHLRARGNPNPTRTHQPPRHPLQGWTPAAHQCGCAGASPATPRLLFSDVSSNCPANKHTRQKPRYLGYTPTTPRHSRSRCKPQCRRQHRPGRGEPAHHLMMISPSTAQLPPRLPARAPAGPKRVGDYGL